MKSMKEILKFSHPGLVHLIGSPKNAQEGLQAAAYEMLKPNLNRSGRNAGDLVRLTIGDPSQSGPDEFPDLARLGAAIYRAAGFRDQFEGLILIDARALASAERVDVPRLRALGEALHLWAGRAYPFIFADGDREILIPMANALDVGGRISVHTPEIVRETVPLHSVIAELGLRVSDSARKALETHVASLAELPGFSAARCLDSIARGGRSITLSMLEAEKSNPFSYSNRLVYKPDKACKRKIGFDRTDDERSSSACTSKDI